MLRKQVNPKNNPIATHKAANQIALKERVFLVTYVLVTYPCKPENRKDLLNNQKTKENNS